MMHAVIMAGGEGTRLWPESRKNKPKQTQPFIDNETLLQKTYKRLLKKFDNKNIWVTTNINNKTVIQNQLPKLPISNYSLEPERRDTLAAIALINLKLNFIDKDSTMININSDSFISDEPRFIKLLDIIENTIIDYPEYLIGIGIIPNSPETAYGYIKKSTKLLTKKDCNIFIVDKFVEKPNLELAKQYIESGDYLWNPTLFAWKTSNMLELFKKHTPDTYMKLMEIKKSLGTPEEQSVINKIFPTIEKTSIDYAIFEKVSKMAVMEGDFGWSDVGSWNTIKDIQCSKNEENVIKGDVYAMDCSDCLFYGTDKKLIVGIGLENLVIVDKEDALLVCRKDRSQEVKKVINWLQENKKDSLL